MEKKTFSPETLQFSAVRILVSTLPSRMTQINNVIDGQRYLGNSSIPEDILRCFVFKNQFSEHHAHLIMKLFTSSFMHSTKLVLLFSSQSSSCIPTARQLNNHLFHHGKCLTELSLGRCSDTIPTDILMEIISRGCSSNLKKLSLPRGGGGDCVTMSGAYAIISAEFAHTLQELNVSSLMFMNINVLLEILSHLSHLRKLEICDVIPSCSDPHHHHHHHQHQQHQLLPVPLDGTLLRLEHLHISSYDLTENFIQLSAEMSRFCKYYPRLKSLQFFQCISLQTDIASLLSLSVGLQERKERLAYLRIETRYGYCRNIVRQMNADKITTGSTIEELLYELKMDGEGGLLFWNTIWIRVSSLEEVWDDESNKDYTVCRDMLDIINILIPKYKDINKVLQVCAKVIFFMVTDPRLRDELELTPSKIETFINLTIDLKNNNDYSFCVIICRIVLVYKDSISVDVFDKVFGAAVRLRWTNPREMCQIIINMVKYSTATLIKREINNLGLLFNSHPDLLEILLREIQNIFCNKLKL